jgi:hypothetical protein
VRAVATAASSPEEAIPLARRAYELVAETEAPLMKGYALLDLGDVLDMAGRHEEATQRWQGALLHLELKGATVPAAWVRKRLGLAPVPT